MAEIIINISACYEDFGWVGSYVSTSNPTEWVKKISDVRTSMGDNNLHTEEAYSVQVNECGTFYNKIIPNKADSRGGFIQGTVVVPVGHRVEDARQVLEVLNKTLSTLPSEREGLKDFFSKSETQIQKVKQLMSTLPATVKLVADYTFANACASEGAQSSKVAYHFYKDERELTEWFQLPHQDEHESFKTIFYIDSSVQPGTSTVKMERLRPQQVYTVKNGSKIYYIKEDTSFDVPLECHMDMEPKTYKVTADGKNSPNGVYTTEKNVIYLDEGKVNFHRTITLSVLFPVSETAEDEIPMPALTLINGNVKTSLVLNLKSEEGKYPRVYETSFDFELKNKDNYKFSLGNGSQLEIGQYRIKSEDHWELPLSFKTRKMKIVLCVEGKEVEPNDIKCPIVELKDQTGQNLKPIYGQRKNEYNCGSGKKYTVLLKSEGKPYILASENLEFDINQSSPIVRVEMKFKSKYVVALLTNDPTQQDAVLCAQTNSLNPDGKHYLGYSVRKLVGGIKIQGNYEEEVYQIDVAPSKFKKLFVLMSAVSGLLLVVTLALSVMLIKPEIGKSKPESIEVSTPTKPQKQEIKKDTTKTDTLTVASHVTENVTDTAKKL